MELLGSAGSLEGTTITMAVSSKVTDHQDTSQGSLAIMLVHISQGTRRAPRDTSRGTLNRATR